MNYNIIEPSNSLALDLLEVKEFLRVNDTEEDFLLEKVFIPSVEKIVEDITGRGLITKKIGFYSNGFINNKLQLPISQIQEIEIKYLNQNSVLTIWDNVNYTFNPIDVPSEVTLSAIGVLPSDLLLQENNFYIEMVIGYGDSPKNIPQNYKIMMLLMLNHLWTNRNLMTNMNMTEITVTLKYLIDGYKKIVLG